MLLLNFPKNYAYHFPIDFKISFVSRDNDSIVDIDERLWVFDLLKETSGTQVYEERRQEIVFDSLNLLLVLNFSKNYVYSFPLDF